MKEYEIDHVIAQKHRGQTIIENLALACASRNLHKGPNVDGLDPQGGALTRLFNPRLDNWMNHFAMELDGHNFGKTDVGRTTIDVLHINEATAIELRRLLILEGLIRAES